MAARQVPTGQLPLLEITVCQRHDQRLPTVHTVGHRRAATYPPARVLLVITAHYKISISGSPQPSSPLHPLWRAAFTSLPWTLAVRYKEVLLHARPRAHEPRTVPTPTWDNLNHLPKLGTFVLSTPSIWRPRSCLGPCPKFRSAVHPRRCLISACPCVTLWVHLVASWRSNASHPTHPRHIFTNNASQWTKKR